MPPSRWPGTEQKNVYSPGWRSTVNSETPPLSTTSPFSSTPLPSTAMLCGDGLRVLGRDLDLAGLGLGVGELVGEAGCGHRDVQRRRSRPSAVPSAL